MTERTDRRTRARAAGRRGGGANGRRARPGRRSRPRAGRLRQLVVDRHDHDDDPGVHHHDHASPSTSTTTTGSSTPPRRRRSRARTGCATSALSISFGNPNGTAGAIHYTITFHNTGSTSCTLYGYPGVSFLTASGAQIGAPAVRQGGSSATVTARPRGQRLQLGGGHRPRHPAVLVAGHGHPGAHLPPRPDPVGAGDGAVGRGRLLVAQHVRLPGLHGHPGGVRVRSDRTDPGAPAVRTDPGPDAAEVAAGSGSIRPTPVVGHTGAVTSRMPDPDDIRTPRQRMLDGDLYIVDDEIAALHLRAVTLTEAFNATPAADPGRPATDPRGAAGRRSVSDRGAGPVPVRLRDEHPVRRPECS